MNTVFFPGKFQPPHIGHVLTISKLMREGYSVVIGISQDTPRVLPQKKVREIFFTIFGRRVEYYLFDGVLTDYKDLKDFPSFDVLASGNDDVLLWGLNLGLSVKKTERSEGIGQSGTELRKLWKK